MLEILFIWTLVYYMIRFLEGTRAIQVLVGLIVLAVIFNIAKYLELQSINWVLTKLFAVGVVAFLIIFQPELRRGLARVGQNTLAGGIFKKGGTLDELVQACEHMARNKVGGLIAIEREVGLKNYIETGILLDAKMSTELLITLFSQNTPTHDGGLIIQGDRIAACGSLFPLSQNMDIARSLGTRHRAAMGLTEDSDAVCVVVSEETGNISVSVYGKLNRASDGEELRRILTSLFKPVEPKKNLKDIFERSWRAFRREESS